MEKLYYFTEATLEDSFIYKTFNNSNNVLQTITAALKNGIHLDKSYIEEQYLQIKKSHMSPLARDVMAAYDNGDIEIVYTKTEKVPVSIPFILRRGRTGTIATIFISSFGSLDSSSSYISIPSKNLYVLLESAYIALKIQDEPTKIARSAGLAKICNEIYTKMVLNILNRDYALSLDKTIYPQITYIVSKFFLTRIWGSINPNIIKSYATSLCINPNPIDIDSVDEKYDNADIKDISDLLMFLKTLTPRLNNLSVKYFMERYITTYNPSAILSIDYLPYLFFVITNTLLGAFIVSQNSLSGIVKDTKSINTFYQELSMIY